MDERSGALGAGATHAGTAQVMAIAGHEVLSDDASPDALGEAGVGTGRLGVRGAGFRRPTGPFGMTRGAGSGRS